MGMSRSSQEMHGSHERLLAESSLARQEELDGGDGAAHRPCTRRCLASADHISLTICPVSKNRKQ